MREWEVNFNNTEGLVYFDVYHGVGTTCLHLPCLVYRDILNPFVKQFGAKTRWTNVSDEYDTDCTKCFTPPPVKSARGVDRLRGGACIRLQIIHLIDRRSRAGPSARIRTSTVSRVQWKYVRLHFRPRCATAETALEDLTWVRHGTTPQRTSISVSGRNPLVRYTWHLLNLSVFRNWKFRQITRAKTDRLKHVL